MNKRLLIPFFWLTSLMTACLATPTPTLTSTSTSPVQKVVIIENAGLICFKEYDAITGKMAGTFVPQGCFSSSCTRPLEQTVKADLDKGQGTIKFNTKFVLLDTTVRTTGAPACTADCSGGGEVSFQLANVMTGTYTVTLGDQTMGSLDVPPVFSEIEGICFGELH